MSNTENSDIDNKIKQVIVSVLNLPEGKADAINGTTTFDELGDSLDIVEVIMGLEEEFDIKIPDEDAESLKTLSDLTGYVKKKVADA